jgi:hypothetical protein
MSKSETEDVETVGVNFPPSTCQGWKGKIRLDDVPISLQMLAVP